MNEPIIIGVDHGYAAMKTAHFSFHTGLVAHEHEPYTLNNVLEYGGKYYVVGSGRQPLQKDKTQTEDYYLLTLAAVAKEMAYRNAGTAADIHLAAGLPLTSFGRDKKAFRDYLCRGGKPVSFRYEGQDYVITISKVSLYTLETSCIQGIVENGGRIRRLMPRECLRLQGFEEWQIDRILAIQSDAQAYKQAGNSVTVNVIEAIAKRIQAVDEELKTGAAA